MSIPTPQIGHLTAEDYHEVYEPAEDSFILLDALEADAFLLRSDAPALSIEIGSGSGVVTAFISCLLGKSHSLQIATDINRNAGKATLRTATANEAKIDVLECNLLDPLLSRVRGRVDLLVFNPPYVPTDDDELKATQEARSIGGAWAGGQTGMQVTDRVLDIVPSLLSPRGRFYLVAIAQNQPEQIIKRMSPNLKGSIVLRRRAGRELLSVIRFTRPQAQSPRSANVIQDRDACRSV